MKTRLFHRKLGLWLFSFGALLGLFFTGLASWADFEAYLFDVGLYSDTGLPTLRCPVMLSPGETGTVRASFTNTADHKLTRRVRLHVSQKLVTLMREEYVNLPLAPGETQKLAWEINSEGAVWERLVLARVYLHRAYPLPSRTSACGVIVANVFGLPGAWIVTFAIGVSLLAMATGIFMARDGNRPTPPVKRRFLEAGRPMKALAIITTAGMLTVLLGQWLLGALLVVLGILLIVTVLAYSVL